jgi:hypothetical protein
MQNSEIIEFVNRKQCSNGKHSEFCIQLQIVNLKS